jgi:hypothetical protein
MSAMHFEVRIERPPALVWSYLSQPDNEPDWQAGVVTSTHEPPGAIQAGTRKTKVRRTPFGQQRFTVAYTRVDQQLHEWEDLVLDGAVRGSTGHYRVVADGSGSRVALDVVMHGAGIGRLLMPMIVRTSRTDLAAGLERLRVVLESA